jgi:glycosyltransferase involved in cell wall biosynthesis
MTKKIYYFTNIASHYRKNLWEKLGSSNNFEFHFFFGENEFLNIKQINFSETIFTKYPEKLHKLKNIWYQGKILIWQKGVLSRCLKDDLDIAIFLGEFNVLSTWCSMIICKIRGIQIVYWTHGLYGNESFYKKKARIFFYKTADKLLLYENRSKELLIKEGFKENKLAVIFNSLDYDNQIKIRKNLFKSDVYSNYFKNLNKTIIFIGRLTKVKKLNLLLKAQYEMKLEGKMINTIFIGEGSELENLKDLALSLNISDNCWFYGATYNEKEIAELIYNANLCVSPGNVGLTAIHSLSYGTPVCTHNNWQNQMPEVEVIQNGITGFFFKEDNHLDLKNEIINWFKQEDSRELIRENCFKKIDEYYNPYYQSEVIRNLTKS